MVALFAPLVQTHTAGCKSGVTFWAAAQNKRWKMALLVLDKNWKRSSPVNAPSSFFNFYHKPTIFAISVRGAPRGVPRWFWAQFWVGSFSGPGLSQRPKVQNVPNESEKSELNPRKFAPDLHPTVQYSTTTTVVVLANAKWYEFSTECVNDWVNKGVKGGAWSLCMDSISGKTGFVRNSKNNCS